MNSYFIAVAFSILFLVIPLLFGSAQSPVYSCAQLVAACIAGSTPVAVASLGNSVARSNPYAIIDAVILKPLRLWHTLLLLWHTRRIVREAKAADRNAVVAATRDEHFDALLKEHSRAEKRSAGYRRCRAACQCIATALRLQQVQARLCPASLRQRLQCCRRLCGSRRRPGGGKLEGGLTREQAAMAAGLAMDGPEFKVFNLMSADATRADEELDPAAVGGTVSAERLERQLATRRQLRDLHRRVARLRAQHKPLPMRDREASARLALLLRQRQTAETRRVVVLRLKTDYEIRRLLHEDAETRRTEGARARRRRRRAKQANGGVSPPPARQPPPRIPTPPPRVPPSKSQRRAAREAGAAAAPTSAATAAARDEGTEATTSSPAATDEVSVNTEEQEHDSGSDDSGAVAVPVPVPSSSTTAARAAQLAEMLEASESEESVSSSSSQSGAESVGDSPHAYLGYFEPRNETALRQLQTRLPAMLPPVPAATTGGADDSDGSWVSSETGSEDDDEAGHAQLEGAPRADLYRVHFAAADGGGEEEQEAAAVPREEESLGFVV